MGTMYLDCGFFVVYAVDDPGSFDFAASLVRDIVALRSELKAEFPIVLLANKVDLDPTVAVPVSGHTPSRSRSNSNASDTSESIPPMLRSADSIMIRPKRMSSGSNDSWSSLGSKGTKSSNGSPVPTSSPARNSVQVRARSGSTSELIEEGLNGNEVVPVRRKRSGSLSTEKEPGTFAAQRRSYHFLPRSTSEGPPQPHHPANSHLSASVSSLSSILETIPSLSEFASPRSSDASSNSELTQLPLVEVATTTIPPENPKERHHEKSHRHHHRRHSKLSKSAPPPASLYSRVVPRENGRKLAAEFRDVDYLEASALSGVNVEMAFECMFWKLLQKYMDRDSSPSK